MRAAPQTTQELCDETSYPEFDQNCNPANLANPEGVDFMASWLGDRILPNISDIHAKLASLMTAEGVQSADYFDESSLNEKQRMAHDMVVEYVRCRLTWDKNGRQGPPPKPLRLVLMGNPGTGKSWTLKCMMSTLIKLIEEDGDLQAGNISWTDRIKLAAPTGAACSQMHFKAETLHRLFSIPINLTEKGLHLEETSTGFSRLLLNFDAKKVLLLIIDEFSMLSRQMFAFVTERLNQCSIDLNNIGIVLIGDPAQILPIAADPLWSARLHNDQGKDCSSISLMGMMRFREVFNLPLLQTIPNYEKWKNLTTPKDRFLSDAITEYRKNLTHGDFEAVFLTEVKRTDRDEISLQFTGKILVNLRYGDKCREKEMNFLRQHCATESEIKSSEEWKTAHIIHGYHFHSKDHANRRSVEGDNAKSLIRHHEMTGNPIMRIDSIHRPVENEAKLKTISAKNFEGSPPAWHACRGMRVMLLRNIAPTLGLYNGSIHTLIGPLYNNDSVDVSLTREHLKSSVLEGSVTTKSIETSGREGQIPSKSILLSINGVPYDDSKFDQLPSKQQMNCKFQLPMNPLSMPDFMVIEASNYKGPNILRLPGCENFVPIAPVESQRQTKSKTKKPQTRIALPLEGGDAATSFKGQGANFHLAEVDLDGWFHVPGMFLVAISRVRSPSHLHIRKFPNHLDIQLQRLSENVLDSQTFEETVRVKSERLYRHKDACSDQFWNATTNFIADKIVEVAVLHGLSIKKDGGKLVKEVQTSYKHLEEESILLVIKKLTETREYRIAEIAPHVSANDYETLQNYKRNKSVQTKSKSVPKEESKLVPVHQNKPKKGKNKIKTVTIQERNHQHDVLVPRENFVALKSRPDILHETFKGLQNSGNNVCFVNAAIIALCHTKAFDTFLRGCHDIHQQCSGHLFDEPCPLCALYEIINRAYRHHRLQPRDVPRMPIVNLTKSLLRGWQVGMEHDADEFLTYLLERLCLRLECNIHKGTVKTTMKCQSCNSNKIKERSVPVRISLHMAQFDTEKVSGQAGINKWTAEKASKACHSCGRTLHDISREITDPPAILIINIHRSGRKTSLIDETIRVQNRIFIFRASINFHPHHYTTVGMAEPNHYVFYSDEVVHTCKGNVSRVLRDKTYDVMSRVRTPLEQCATVLLYELQNE